MAGTEQRPVDDEDNLHRRVPHRLENFLAYDDNEERWTIGNAALRFDPDLSVYVESLVAELGLAVEDELAAAGVSIAMSARVRAVRDRGFEVDHTPVDPPVLPIDEAHGSVWKDAAWSKADFKQRRNQLRKEFHLSAGEITLDPAETG